MPGPDPASIRQKACGSFTDMGTSGGTWIPGSSPGDDEYLRWSPAFVGITGNEGHNPSFFSFGSNSASTAS